MRLDTVLASALFSSATLLGHVRADEVDDALESSTISIAEASTSLPAEKPTFTVRTRIQSRSGPCPQPSGFTDLMVAAFRYQSTLLRAIHR